MGESVGPISLVVAVGDATADDNEIDALTRRLRQQLTEFDVDLVELASAGQAPAGSKSAEAAAVGTLVLTLLPAVLPKVIDFLQGWILRDKGRTVKIRAAAGDRSFDVEYSAGATSEAELKRLLQTLTDALGRTSGSA